MRNRHTQVLSTQKDIDQVLKNEDLIEHIDLSSTQTNKNPEKTLIDQRGFELRSQWLNVQ